ncbi:ABC transporter-like [Syntrophomonas zehnderi OL-4]|uniref:ABC transporter-like n=1 Tax=Syntrophomonas zehnderi OL-4 TaxID=690567 RepID=A0A0E4C954_9FIRM|nr:ABC transporter ATP-binding protein [Syntrophomonas zehnderi]CFX83895.1 ABC transporter-like [Syntrophomonas zehnderi OL-4]
MTSGKETKVINSGIIQIDKLRKIYRLGDEKVIALDNISLQIARGEICCILGPSGSGKSTLLNMMAGLEKPSRGSIIIRGHEISRMNENQLARFRQKYIGFVFQSYNLLPTLTALENVSLPLTFRGVKKGVRDKQALKMLTAVGLKKHRNHKPAQMSGGQQQRVGIARAFVSHPTVIFADEPTGNLDSKTSSEVMQLIVQMARQNQQTLVIVTHDAGVAAYADRIVHILDGNIAQIENITETREMKNEV